MIGAGTYADNRACAVSATGWGEYFLRVGVAHENLHAAAHGARCKSCVIKGLMQGLALSVAAADLKEQHPSG